ncbi:diaminobutyrate acetyltransferase [Maritalea sp. S77]|uniref:diaminobutyrate acetyltransferase n=1 Tax=Maritalea sp. S77 TaxID=3415125 RepID=UPI003C7CE7CD
MKTNITKARPIFRKPTANDGSVVWDIVKNSGKLDENSIYCNLLQCTHFAGTCAIAEVDGKPMGWISAYIPPQSPDTLFVWQVCVAEEARGLGIAKQLIHTVLKRDVCEDVRKIESTITKDNDASWALFGAIADNFGADLDKKVMFDEEKHLDGQGATEHLVSIAPVKQNHPVLRSVA